MSRLSAYSPTRAKLLQIGDILLREVCGQSKRLTNFVQNYSLILRTLDRAHMSNTAFRAFLTSREKETIRSRMLKYCLLYY